MDFISDALANGRAIRALTVLDDFTKESPAIEVDCSLSAPRVTRVLDAVIDERGIPGSIRIDNGPEFTSRCFVAWAEQRGIKLIYIQPGKPVQNSFIESLGCEGAVLICQCYAPIMGLPEMQKMYWRVARLSAARQQACEIRMDKTGSLDEHLLTRWQR